MRRFGVLVVALAVLAVDQLTKVVALDTLGGGRVVRLLGDFLSLRLIANAGAAFSVGAGRTWVVTVVAVVICGLVLVQIQRGVTHRVWAWTLGVLLGGALGNLGDRLFRAPGFGRGHVVDFIDYNGYFIGNVADIAIVAAAVVVAWLSLRDVPPRPQTQVAS